MNPTTFIKTYSKYLLIILLLTNSCLLYSQDESEKTRIVDERNEILDKYYYSDFDSARILLKQLAAKAKTKQYDDEYLNTILELVWVAEAHTEIDTLQYYISFGEAEMSKMDMKEIDADGIILANFLYAKGMYYYHLGNASKSVDAFLDLVKSFDGKAVTDSLLMFDAYSNISSGYYAQENYLKSITYNDLARNWISKPESNPKSIEDYNYQLAFIKTLSGRSLISEANRTSVNNNYINQAFESYFEADALLENVSLDKKRNLKRSIYSNLAKTYQLTLKPDSAIYYLEKALKLYEPQDVNNRKTLTSLGEVYQDQNQYEEALNSYDQSLKITLDNYNPNHPEIAALYTKIGEVHSAQQQWQDAMIFFQKSTAILTREPELSQEKDFYKVPSINNVIADKEFLEILTIKAKSLLEQFYQTENMDALAASQQFFDLAITHIDSMRFKNTSIDYKQYLSSKSHTIYESALSTSFLLHQIKPKDQNALKKAFYYAEKSKSLNLLEAVNDSNAKKFASVPDSLIELENTYKGKIAYLKKEIDRIKNQGKELDDELSARLLLWEEKFKYLISSIEQQFPDYYQLKYGLNVVDLENVINQQLNDGDLLIEYFYGDKHLYFFGIHQSKVVFERIEKTDILQNRIQNTIEKLTQYNLDKANQEYEFYAKNCHQLYNDLLNPILSNYKETDIESVCIVADGSLGYLPFEILLTSLPTEANKNNFKNFPYLLKKYPISYAFSATLKYLDSNQPANTKEWDYLGFAPEYETDLLASVNNQPAITRNGFSVLLNNQPEIENVSALFNSKIFLGKAATKKAFQNTADKASILHLSMHAFANDQQPALSGLVFTQENNSSPDSSILYAYELYNMNLDAQLAILSGCETGIGYLAKGEGIMSLGRAFKYAGCKEITMSLWKVNDKVTAEIVELYSKNLKEGMDKAKALQKAKIDYLESTVPIQQHPYFWSSFILQGDDTPIHQNSIDKKWIYGIAFCLIVILTIILLKRRKG